MKLLYDRNMAHGKTLFARLGDASPCDGRVLTKADLGDTELLFVRSTCKLNADLLAGTKVRFVGSGVAGTDHIDFEALRRLGITVATAPGCNAESVADWFVSALLTLGARGRTTWAGKTLGVVGVGHVGKIVARFAEEALGMRILRCDPPRKEREYAASDFVELDTLLPLSDVITFHTPLTREGPDKTVGLFSGPRVRLTKPGAVLFNLARGPVCDNALLATMAETGLLSEVVVDCWEGEPDYSPELAAMAAIASPHIAGHAYEGRADGTYAVYQAACDFLGVPAGRRPAYPAAPVPRLTLDCAGLSDEAVLHAATSACCDTLAEDARFRAAFSPLSEGRRAAFDSLRKTVLHRRLFTATTVVPVGATAEQIRKLKALGFRIGRKSAKD